jgi:DNA repair ATPase RecN
MLTHLSLQNVGAAPKLELNLAPRFNLITGDNGLGNRKLIRSERLHG